MRGSALFGDQAETQALRGLSSQANEGHGVTVQMNGLRVNLKHLADKGLVTVRFHNVKGTTRRLKVYLLTSSGAILARKQPERVQGGAQRASQVVTFLLHEPSGYLRS